MPTKLVFATNNQHKLSEIRAILGEECPVLSLDEIGCHADIPETANTLEGNALQKARWIYEHCHCNCFADDTGLEVDALGGEPGVMSARYAAVNGKGDGHDASANSALLLERLRNITNRKARFRTVIALIIDGKETLVEGIVNGQIATEPKGTDGFGYDPLFIPDGYNQTFAEMTPEQKNSISHRRNASEALRQELAQLKKN
jgi:XTP/dITP diphosphohydrolase